MECRRCGTENPDEARYCNNCGIALKGPPGGPPEEQGDATGGIIPYKNPMALVSYYLGIFSIIPFLGIVLGIMGVIFGIIGLRARAKNPHIRGLVHALIGIIGGGFFALLWGGLFLMAIVSAIASQ